MILGTLNCADNDLYTCMHSSSLSCMQECETVSKQAVTEAIEQFLFPASHSEHVKVISCFVTVY